MKKIIICLFAVGLTGCEAELPILGSALDGKISVPIEAKVVKNSGEVVPVADTTFTWSTSVANDKGGSFTTDFDGKSNIRVVKGATVYVTGKYSTASGASTIRWDGIAFSNLGSGASIRLSNSNGIVDNN